MSDVFAPAKISGVDYFAAAAEAGVSIQARRYTQVGATPVTINLAAAGFTAMADNTYVAIVQNSSDAAATMAVTYASSTAKQLVVAGGANGNVLSIVLIGRLAGQSAGRRTKGAPGEITP